jgi:hypothetical protein
VDEVYELLKRAGLPVVPYRIVGDVESAATAAAVLGFPVVVKAIRPGVVHKLRAGAVALNVSDQATLGETLCRLERHWGPGPYLVQPQVNAGIEWLLGAVRDRSYGRVILFGPGGVWAEVLADISVRLAPLSAEEGLAMLADIRCQRFFDGLGSCPPVDRRALADLLARVSRWVAASPWLAELDLNPVIANDFQACWGRLSLRPSTSIRPHGAHRSHGSGGWAQPHRGGETPIWRMRHPSVQSSHRSSSRRAL